MIRIAVVIILMTAIRIHVPPSAIFTITKVKQIFQEVHLGNSPFLNNFSPTT
jgi:hypothetical protein